MKIKEIVHENTVQYQKLTPLEKLLLNHVHELQEKVEMLMGNLETTQVTVKENKAYVDKPKYHVPWGDYKTYKAAAEAQPTGSAASASSPNKLKWTEIRRRIKNPNFTDYYLNV